MNTISRRSILAAGLILPATSLISAKAAEPLKMRVSVDVPGTANRGKFMQRYVDLINQRAGGQIKAELFHSGQLYKDRDVPKALRQGSLEMGCPATWFLSSLDPNLDLLDSSLVYGAHEDRLYAMLNGPIGQEINSSVEKKFNVKVPGEWFGHAASGTYSVAKPINSTADLAGLKIRTPGGAGVGAVVRAFKATPVQLPWPDVPMALAAGTFDALITGNDGVTSTKLWDAGLKYAYANRVSYAFYVPMISETFWARLTPEQRKMLVDTWAEIRPEGRKASLEADQNAEAEMKRRGMKVVTPTDAELAAQKAFLMSSVDLTKVTRIDPAFLKRVADALR